jgi:hypothetical protein
MNTWAKASLLLLAVAPLTPEPAFFRFEREVNVSGSTQNYFVVDPGIWAHARPGLADLRLYHGSQQIPYVLAAEQSAGSSDQREAKILNLGLVKGAAEFDLDMRDLPEYDRVTLRLGTKNFVAKAEIEGRNQPGAGPGSQLGTSTVYDFSHENLGSNSTLRFPAATFPYLHIRLGPGVEPKDVQGASIANVREAKAVWIAAGSCGSPKQDGRFTETTCDVAQGAPLGRLTFRVPAERANFNRAVVVLDGQGRSAASGSISRVRLKRGDTEVKSEQLVLNVWGMTGPGTIRVRIDNGDDAPLAFETVVPQLLERRVYFDSQGQGKLTLYYGDPKLEPPVYDYAKFFREEGSAVEARLGAETQNPAYTGRPDDRPWSERHKSVLWAAMVLAIAVLAALAFRGLMTVSSVS